jgi:hypothetical protein
MEKIFKQPKGDFIITFADELQISSYAGINPISISFVPGSAMEPYAALEYANEFSEFIVKEAKIILAEQHEFYKDWEIRFSNQFTATASVRHDVDSDLLAARKVMMNVYCKRLVK